MHIDVHRTIENAFATIGKFVVDSGESYNSLELPYSVDGKTNVPDETCIPAGTYALINAFSEKHGRMMPHVSGVPDRTAIEIHAASRPRDLLGCTAIGSNLYDSDPKSVNDVVINGSDQAFAEFQSNFEASLSNGESATITYSNEFSISA